MGGVPPLGYDLPVTGTRVLRVNEAEAVTVRHIFARYLALGSVHRLTQELAEQGITSKQRITGSGKSVGGVPFSRGALFHLLKSRIYLGQIPHKDAVHEGQHDAIVPVTVFEKVQSLLSSQTRRRADQTQQSLACARLTGRIFDAAGNPMSPTHARGKTGKLYRYYVSAPLQQGVRNGKIDSTAIQRISAPALEDMVQAAVTRILSGSADPLRLVKRIEIQQRRLLIQITAPDRAFTGLLGHGETLARDPDLPGSQCLTLPIILSSAGPRAVIARGAPLRSRRDPTMIAALRRAHAIVTRDAHGPTLIGAPASQYGRRLASLALLAPDIQRDILAGRQPQQLTLAQLMAEELPLDWVEQRRRLGFAVETIAAA